MHAACRCLRLRGTARCTRASGYSWIGPDGAVNTCLNTMRLYRRVVATYLRRGACRPRCYSKPPCAFVACYTAPFSTLPTRACLLPLLLLTAPTHALRTPCAARAEHYLALLLNTCAISISHRLMTTRSTTTAHALADAARRPRPYDLHFLSPVLYRWHSSTATISAIRRCSLWTRALRCMTAATFTTKMNTRGSCRCGTHTQHTYFCCRRLYRRA